MIQERFDRRKLFSVKFSSDLLDISKNEQYTRKELFII